MQYEKFATLQFTTNNLELIYKFLVLLETEATQINKASADSLITLSLSVQGDILYTFSRISSDKYLVPVVESAIARLYLRVISVTPAAYYGYHYVLEKFI